MAKPVDMNFMRDYVPKGADPASVSPVKFKLGMLDYKERTDVKNDLTHDFMDQFVKVKVVQYGLKGWEGLPGAFKTVDRDIPKVGKRSVVADECLDLIEPFINELSAEILKDNFPEETDQKN